MNLDPEFFQETVKAFANDPIMQGWAVAVATFFFENIVCWTLLPPLIATGYLPPSVAFHAALWGVFVGDILMYLPARFAMRYICKLKVIKNHIGLISVFEEFFSKHLGKTMFIIRFTPGIRTFALIAAGMLRVPITTYTIYSFLSCALQAAIVIFGGKVLLRKPIEWLEALWQRSPLAAGAIVAVLVVGFLVGNAIIAKRVTKELTERAKLRGSLPEDPTPIGLYEFWSFLAFAIPSLIYGYYRMLFCHKCWIKPCSINPAISTTSYLLESKSKALALIQPVASERLVRFCVIEPAMTQTMSQRIDAVLQANFPYPFVVKPDIGHSGEGVKLIRGQGDLEDFLRAYPRTQKLIVQENISSKMELTLSYYRAPSHAHGHLCSAVIRHPLIITGDGKHSIRQLILASNRGRRLPHRFYNQLSKILDDILPANEAYRVNYPANHRLGTRFETLDLHQLMPIIPAINGMLEQIDGIHHVQLTIKGNSIESIAAGHYTIIGFSTAMSPLEMFDPGCSFLQVYHILFRQIRRRLAVALHNRTMHGPTIPYKQVFHELYGIYKTKSKDLPQWSSDNTSA